MTSLKTRIGRFQAPVDYSSISARLQRVRRIAAGAVLVACVIGMSLGVPGAWVPTSMAGAVLLHAILRGPRQHPAIEPLLVDALAISIGIGAHPHSHIGLVAAAAYLISASITFGGLAPLLASLTTFAAGITVSPFVPWGVDSESWNVELITWFVAAVLLAGVALSLTAAASAVYHTRERQHDALEEVKRASEMKNQFVSMVTHELRTPLTNIAGFADTLAQTWRDLPEDDVDEFLRIIVSESDHLQNLVEDVLAIPRLEAGRLLLEVTDFQLRPAAFKVANLLFPEGGDRRASVSIGGNVMVTADPNRVEQILRNLLENARKYGGDQVNVEAIPLESQWQIVVSDTGQGLPPEDRERVFGAFEQVTAGDSRTETGFGLGLAVAKNLVEAMGGRIWYEPGFPVGARFCFTLPASSARPSVVASEVA